MAYLGRNCINGVNQAVKGRLIDSIFAYEKAKPSGLMHSSNTTCLRVIWLHVDPLARPGWAMALHVS